MQVGINILPLSSKYFCLAHTDLLRAMFLFHHFNEFILKIVPIFCIHYCDAVYYHMNVDTG